MINTLSKINLSKLGWEGGRPTSIWIMSLNILVFFLEYPLSIQTSWMYGCKVCIAILSLSFNKFVLQSSVSFL